MKCLNNENCRCPICKRERKRHRKYIKSAAIYSEIEVINNIKRYRGRKYPQTIEEYIEKEKKAFWCGVWFYQTYHQEAILKYKIKVRAEKIKRLNKIK